MRKKWIALSLLSLVTSLCAADEFWVEAERFYFNPGETAHISLKTGDDFIGEIWSPPGTDAFQRVEDRVANQVYNLKRSFKAGNEALGVRLTAEGSHVVVLETTRSFAKMDGEKFTGYLREEGLDDIYYQREKMKISSDSATEYYSRYAKLILQSGTKIDDTYKQVCNLPIEIIPDQNPAGLKKGDPIKFKILYQGKPLFGAKVKVWNRYNHRTTVQNIYSQQDGMIETHVSNPGAWMISVVNMVPSKDPKAQYRSFWGSLVFGVR
jgi:hypothetical protein